MANNQRKRPAGRKASSSRQRSRRQKDLKRLLIVLLLVVLVVGGGLFLLSRKSPPADPEYHSSSQEQETEQTSEAAGKEPSGAVTFPYELDEGRLVVNSLFQSSIENPDCGNEEGEDIASVEVLNQSGRFLASADLTITLEDGTELHFQIEDVPDGMTVWAFDTDNTRIDANPVCAALSSGNVYEEETPLMADRVAVESSETMVTLRNLTDETLTYLGVRVHCLFGENVYFGGRSYRYMVEEIPAGGSAVIDAEECYLGTAQAVRITQE